MSNTEPKAKKAAAGGAPGRKAAAPEPAAEAPAGQEVPEVALSNALRKKDLVDLVANATGGKRKEVRDVVDATLAAIGEALSRGEELNLPPLGHVKVHKQNDFGAGARMVLRLRRGKEGEKDSPEALAETDE